jgi:hypothetical protein
MWKLIKYELRTKWFSLVALLLSITILDIFLVYSFKSVSDSLLIIDLGFAGLLFLFLTVLSNATEFYRDLQSNHQSFLSISSEPVIKIIFAKLVVIFLKFFSVIFLHFLFGLYCVLVFIKTNKEFVMTQYQTQHPYLIAIGYWMLFVLFIFLAYLIFNFVIDATILNIRWYLHRSKAKYWISLLTNGFYFFIMLFYTIKVLASPAIPIRPIAIGSFIFLPLLIFTFFFYLIDFFTFRLEF